MFNHSGRVPSESSREIRLLYPLRPKPTLKKSTTRMDRLNFVNFLFFHCYLIDMQALWGRVNENYPISLNTP
jgi:hypothetical protein